jgi:hypothetical protein
MLPPPRSLTSTTPRQRPTEFRTIRIQVDLKEAKVESDLDVHMIVASSSAPTKTMILEFPDIRCEGAARSYRKLAIKRARSHLLHACGPIGDRHFKDLDGNATITGVGFWDHVIGQKGVAPNGIELHPVLGFKGTCL